MTIEFRKKRAVFAGVVAVDEAEALLEWLQRTPGARVDLSACTHMHPANLQVLMAANAVISAAPADAELAGWLASALAPA